MENLRRYTYESVLAEGSHCVIDFDKELCAKAYNLYPHIAEQVDNQFGYINLNMLLTRDQMYAAIDKDINTYTGFKIARNASSIVNNSFYIRNHMFSVDICILDEEGKEVDIPIEKLYLYTECAYYSKKRTPSMVLFVDHSTSTGIFTRGGKINLVGGYTQNEVKYALNMFLGRIESGIRKLYSKPSLMLTIKDTRLENYVVSSKIPYSKIDIYNTSKYLDTLGIPKIFVPEHCNLLNIRPFPTSVPSIHIRVFPTGGIVLAGCKSVYEISITVQFLIGVIEKFIVEKWPKVGTKEAAFIHWSNERETKTYKRELVKLKQMQKKRSQWELHKQIHMLENGLPSFDSKAWTYNIKPPIFFQSNTKQGKRTSRKRVHSPSSSSFSE